MGDGEFADWEEFRYTQGVYGSIVVERSDYDNQYIV
jgi:hypothetical protein